MIYGNFAKYYDELMIDFDYQKVYQFILAETKISTKKILELGCGTGEMTKRLSDKFIVYGIDNSEDMLAICEQKLRNTQSKLFLQDMKDIKFFNEFDFAISVCDSMNYLTKQEDFKQTIKSVYESLKSSGVFIFDLNTFYKFDNMEEVYVDENEDVFYVWENYFNREEKINSYCVNFFVKDGNKYRRFYEEHLQKAYSNDFVVQVLKEAGFVKIEVFNDYTGNKGIENSNRNVYVARR